MHPYTHLVYTHVHHLAPGYTWHHLGMRQQRDGRHGRLGAAQEGMGLTLGNFRSCTCPIQRRAQDPPYSEYRSALEPANRSAYSSSLGRNITKIGHGRLERACFRDCDLKHDPYQCMSTFSYKKAKITFQLLAENCLKIGCASRDYWPVLTRMASFDHFWHAQTPKNTWRGHVRVHPCQAGQIGQMCQNCQ